MKNFLENSESYKKLLNFDKSFLRPYIEKNENLHIYTELYEYIDEIFFIAETAAKRSLYCLNKTSSCALLNYLANEFFYEEIYNICNNMVQNYLKREYFNLNLIGFNTKFTVYNTFIIVLLNNIEMFLNYLKKLKNSLIEEYQASFGDEKQTMIVSCIQDLEGLNVSHFKQLINIKIKTITEFLKQTVKFIETIYIKNIFLIKTI